MASGFEVGQSLSESDMVESARQILDLKGINVPLPVDVITAKEFSSDAEAEIKAIDQVAGDDLILDIGPETAMIYKDVIDQCRTIIWNGPVGVFEFEQFSEGTRFLSAAIESNPGFKIVGGGDTVAVVEKYQITDSISYISTGGGAFLEFVKNGTLPILDLLKG